DPDGSIVNWHWDFGDGYIWDSSYPGAYHYYYALGTYNVTVTARDNDGLETSASMLLQVVDQPPYACFYVYPNPTVVGYPTNFQSCSWDRDGYIVSSEWDFGDGGQANGSYVTHAFTDPGSYGVRLTVTDNGGNIVTTNQSVTVNVNQLPVAQFTYYPSDPIAGQYVSFNGGGSYDPDGYITLWYWDWGDGTNQTNSWYGDVYHYYARGGRYTVTLTVTDNFNGKNSSSASLYVDIPPNATFTTTRPFGKVGTPLVFDGSASNDPDGRIVRYEWNFDEGGSSTEGSSVVRQVWQLGDGAVGEGSTLTHRYAYPGTYTVHLTVVDEDGIAVTTSSDITVVSRPVAAFSVAPGPIHASEDVTFTANGSWDLT